MFIIHKQHNSLHDILNLHVNYVYYYNLHDIVNIHAKYVSNCLHDSVKIHPKLCVLYFAWQCHAYFVSINIC